MSDVLILCEYATLHGGEQSMLVTLTGAERAGFHVAVAAPPTGQLAEALRARNVELVPFRVTDEQGVRPSQDELRKQLRELLARRRPPLVHANSLSMARLSGPVVAELGIAGIGHLRDIVRLSSAAIGDLNRHTRLLAVSRATRDYHVHHGLSAEKTFVLHNGVDLERFCPRPPTGDLHRQLSLPADTPLIGCVGQISMRKGQDVLLEAAKELSANHGHVHWLIVGQRYSQKDEARQFERDLHRVAAEKPLAGRVHFLGWRNDVETLLSQLTLLVHAARQEPLGRVLLEAAATALPVVATDVGGTREIFINRQGRCEARLVAPDDPAGMARAIAQLLDDPATCRQLGAAARARAEETFGAAAATVGLIGHYRQVLATG